MEREIKRNESLEALSSWMNKQVVYPSQAESPVGPKKEQLKSGKKE